MFPLGMVIFPYQTAGLYVFEARYQQMLTDLDDEGTFGTTLIERGSEVGVGDVRLGDGSVVKIVASQKTSDGKTLLVVEGIECCEVVEWLIDDPYPQAIVKERHCTECGIDETLLRSTESAVKALRALQSEINADDYTRSNCEMDSDPKIRSWQLCAMTPMSTLDQFKVLSLANPNDRLRLLSEICCERYGDFQRMLAIDSSN